MAVLKCSNCDSVLTHSTKEDGVISVEPCSCRGNCPLCGGSGVDFDAKGYTRPCPCTIERKVLIDRPTSG